MLLHNEQCPFSFDDWQVKKIIKLYAGGSCIMAITADGRVLQKVLNKDLAARTMYWKNIKSISISTCFPALAVGLVDDGTCMVSKRALRNCCEITQRSFDIINSEIRALRDIVEVVVSDAIFALDSSGRVHHIPLWRDDAYKDVSSWQNISHIAVGSQDSVFGITKSGTVVCAGSNATKGACGNLKDKLVKMQNAVDICSLGSECETVIVAFSDGRTVDSNGDDLNIENSGKWPVFSSDRLNFTAVNSVNNTFRCVVYNYYDDVSEIENTAVSDIVSGVDDEYRPFVVWMK